MPTVEFLAPLSSLHQKWTREEEEALFDLRNEGKTWEHIGERVLGRTVKGVKKRWEYLRTDSLKAAKMRTTTEFPASLSAPPRFCRALTKIISIILDVYSITID